MTWSNALPEAAHILRRLIDAASPNPPGDCEAVSRVCVELLEHDVSDVQILRAPDWYAQRAGLDRPWHENPSLAQSLRHTAGR